MSDRERDAAGAERFLPEAHGALMAHEHVHRYALAAALLGGRRVLDLGSGAGYGAALLRAGRARVIGLDLDAAAARRAAPAVRGSALALPFAAAGFDGVVCFEMIEHVAEPERVLDEIARVLSRDGIALVSTPDRDVYTERAGNRNPFHVRELARLEFAALVGARFAATALFGQSLWAGSWIARLDAAGATPAAAVRRVRALELAVDPRAARAPWADPERAEHPVPLYLIALCAHDPAVLARFERRVGSDQILRDRMQRILGEHYALTAGIAARDRERASAEAHAGNLDALLRERAARIAALEAHAGNLERRLGESESHAANLASLRAELETSAKEQAMHAANLEQLLAQAQQRATSVEAHARNVESGAAGHRSHAGNLERLLDEQRTHAGNLERLLDEQRTHAGNLERRVAEVEAHAANIEKVAREHRVHVDGLERHVANLEALLLERNARVDGLTEHTRNLEQVLAERADRVAGLERQAADFERRVAEQEARLAGAATRLSEAERSGTALAAQLAAEQEALSEARGLLQETQAALAEARAAIERLRAARWSRAGRRLGLID